MKKFIIVIITILMSVVSYAQVTKTIDFNSLNWGFSDNMIYHLESEGKVVFQHKERLTNKVVKFAVSDSVFLALYNHYKKNGNELEKAIEILYKKAEKKYPFIHEINTEKYNLLKGEKISNLSMDDLDYIKWYDSIIKRYGSSFVEKLEKIKDTYYEPYGKWFEKGWVNGVGISGFKIVEYYHYDLLRKSQEIEEKIVKHYDLLRKNQEQIIEEKKEDYDKEKEMQEFSDAIRKNLERPIVMNAGKYVGNYDFVIYPQDKCEKFIKEYKTLVYSVL